MLGPGQDLVEWTSKERTVRQRCTTMRFLRACIANVATCSFHRERSRFNTWRIPLHWSLRSCLPVHHEQNSLLGGCLTHLASLHMHIAAGEHKAKERKRQTSHNDAPLHSLLVERDVSKRSWLYTTHGLTTGNAMLGNPKNGRD